MKTLHFSENYDLCRPLLGCENSNNNSNIIANTHGHPTSTVTSGVTYGNNSIEQTSSSSSKFDKNANDFHVKQQQQEQNKKRKRETGEYSSLTSLIFFL